MIGSSNTNYVLLVWLVVAWWRCR